MILNKCKKKAQAALAVGTLITLMVGVGIATLVIIFTSSLGGLVYEGMEDDINTIGLQESTSDYFTFVWGQGVQSLNHTDIKSGTLAVVNTTTGASIKLANFSIDYDAGTINYTCLTCTLVNNTGNTVSYQWYNTTISRAIKGGILSSFKSMEATASYMKLIVLAVVIGVVLMIVLGFSMGSVGGGGGFNRGSAL